MRRRASSFSLPALLRVPGPPARLSRVVCVRMQRRGRDQRSMASVTSHATGGCLCVEPQRSFEPASAVVRLSAMVPLPSLMRGAAVDRVAAAADGNGARLA